MDSEALAKRVAALVAMLGGTAEGLTPQQKEDVRLELLSMIDGTQTPVASSKLIRTQELLDFMICDNMDSNLELWFGKSEETDRKIWLEFGHDVVLATRGFYDHAAAEPEGLIALLILLDQFRRNLYRNHPSMYDADPKCVEMVQAALNMGLQEKLAPVQRVFMCLVLTHSEDVERQRQCMEEWAKVQQVLPEGDPLHVFHEVFNRHVAVVERFGRFPHRNELLGRASTPEEEDFLNDASFRFDLPLHKSKDGFTFLKKGHEKMEYTETEFLGKKYQTLVQDESEDKNAYRLVFDPTKEEKQKTLRIGDEAPDLLEDSTQGKLRFHEYLGDSWGVLFSHPADFTPICTTEIALLAKAESAGEFAKRKCKLLVVSVDGVADHHKWIKDIERVFDTKVRFPLVSDVQRRISQAYGMIDQTTFFNGDKRSGVTVTVRSVFIISPSKKIQLMMSYPSTTGRNIDEIIRALDSLQLTAYQGVAIPANWTKGQDVVILPSVTDAEAKRLFPEGVRKETNYLRYVADPSLRAMKRHSFRGLAKSVVAMQRWGSNIADREVQVCEPASVLDIGPDNYGPDEEEGLKEEGEKDCGKIEEE